MEIEEHLLALKGNYNLFYKYRLEAFVKFRYKEEI